MERELTFDGPRSLRSHTRSDPLTRFKQRDGRNTLYTELSRDFTVGVDIDLHNTKLLAVRSCENFEFGCDHFARPTPTRPEVDKYWHIRLENFTLK